MRSDFVDVPLFDLEPAPQPPDPLEGLGQDARRTYRQREMLLRGKHPNTHAPLHADAAPVDDKAADGLRCRGCLHHQTFLHHNLTYPKCMHPRHGRGNTASAASDCRGWWPACIHFEPKEDGA